MIAVGREPQPSRLTITLTVAGQAGGRADRPRGQPGPECAALGGVWGLRALGQARRGGVLGASGLLLGLGRQGPLGDGEGGR